MSEFYTTPNDTRLSYDSSSYDEKLKRSIAPGLYNVNVPDNDCDDCAQDIPADPHLRFQKYGHNSCSFADSVDDSSELKGLNYKNSKSNNDKYLPNSYTKKSSCNFNASTNPRNCFTPQESTRLSNPTITLKSTGINRWEWLYNNPQEFAIEKFNRIPINYRQVAKDNHIPHIDTPLSDQNLKPTSNNLDIDPSDNLKSWNIGNATHCYAPGNPNGIINYNFACY